MNDILPIRIRELRKAAGYTQEGLAERASIHRTHLNQIENGHREPSLDSACRLAIALNTSVDYLCGLSDYRGDKWTPVKSFRLKQLTPKL